MKRFRNLLIKEIRELITLQLIISLLFTLVLFFLIGTLLKQEVKRAAKAQKISVLDLDGSPFSGELLGALKAVNFQIEQVPKKEKTEALEAARLGETKFLVIIPQGFGESISRFETREVETYSFLRSFSLSALRNSAVLKSVIGAMNTHLSNSYLQKKIPDLLPENLKNPIKSKDFVFVKERMAEGSAEAISGFVYSQSIFVPVILMMILIYSSQMVISAIAMEKQNKTLETLLTVPIPRVSIVAAKMLSSGLVGLISAAIYMIGFRVYLTGWTGDMRSGANVSQVVQNLGLVLNAKGFVILGVMLFLAILCALALAIILGVLAEDFRSAQSLIMPLMFLVLIPYFISFFGDLKSMSLPVKILLLAIPFSHPFLATQNLLLENYAPVVFGILYMTVVFVALVILAGRIFSSDKVLTMKLRLGKKKIVL
jgi:ABC-2 type transport system permease protein